MEIQEICKPVNVKFLIVEECPVCNSLTYEFLFNTYDVQFSKTLMMLPLVKCVDCGLAYLKRRPASSYMSNFYPNESYPTYSKKMSCESEKQLYRKVRRTIKARLNKRKTELLDRLLLAFVPDYWRLAVRFSPNSKVFDIGCGAGWRLDRFKEFEWKTYGNDFSSNAVEIAKAKGHHVIEGEIDDIDYPKGFFDAVQISHVIEHLPDPVVTIKKAYSLLKDGGVLLLETPNSEGLIARIFHADFWQIDSPRHFQLFNKSNLKAMLEKCGFQVEKLKTYNSRNCIINSIQAFVVRKFGKEKNIKDNVFLKPVNLMMVSIVNMFNKFGLGENIIVFAKKDKSD